MTDLILIILGVIIGPMLLWALGSYIWYKIWPRAKTEGCQVVREDDSFAIYDDYFPKYLNPVGHIYIKNNKAEVHIRKNFEDEEVVEYEPIESWVADDEIFKGYQVGVKGGDESAGKLSFEAIRNLWNAFFSQHDYKATIEKPSSDELVVASEVSENEEVELKNTKSFKIKECGRLKKEVDRLLPLRKLLCGYLAIQDDIRKRYDDTVADGGYKRRKPSPKDTIFMAGLFFALIFIVVDIYFPYPAGDKCSIRFTPYGVSMVGVFLIIWWVLYEVHVEFTFKNTKFTQFLMLFNRWTGMKTGHRILFLFLGIGALYNIYIDLNWFYVVLFAVFCSVINYGRTNFNLWKVDDPLLPMLQKNEIDDEKIDDGAEDPNPNDLLYFINSYHWSISGTNGDNKLLLKLKFDKNKMAGLSANYDNSELLNSGGDPADVARYFVEAEKDSLHIKKLCWFIDNATLERGYSRMQKMQMILDFAQDRESFYSVEDSLTSGRLRSAEEILYSKKATMMDRAMLAATIYATMDYSVNILQSRDGRVALEVAEKDNVCKDLCGAIRNEVFSYNDAVYYVCDMQDEHFVIGSVPSFRKKDFIRRICIS